MPSIEDKLMTASQIKEVTDTKLDKDFSNSDINPSVLTNLGSTSADDILKTSPRPGVTGVLPLVNGGVGSSTAAGARTNLDVYSKSETNSAIQQSTASKAGVVTMHTGTSNLTVRQSGNTVYIGGWVSNATIAANAEVKIADISGVSLPPDSVRTFCNVGANAYSVGTLSYITLGTGGSLYVISSNGGTGKAIYFDICYVANN